MSWNEDNDITLEWIGRSLERIAKAQERIAESTERIAEYVHASGIETMQRMTDTELREIMGHGDIPDEPPELPRPEDYPVICGRCGVPRADDDAAHKCAMSHV